MKQRFLGLMALIALAACAKEELPVTPEKPTEPEIPVIEKIDMQFTAVTYEATRTSLNTDNRVFWKEGDAISVFSDAALANNEEFTSSNISESSAIFSGQVAEGTKYYAAYPYNAANKIEGTTLSMEIPAEQAIINGTFANGANPSAAVTTGTDLQFHNIAALISFTVPEFNGCKIVKAIFKGNKGEKTAGQANVDMSQEPLAAVPATDAVAEAALTGAFVTGETYYLATIPGTFTSGITLSLIDEGGKSYSIRGSQSVTTTAGKILPLADFEFVPDEVGENFYVKTNGTGNGSDWANATTLTNALAWAKEGNTIHLAAGTYDPVLGAPAADAFVLDKNIRLIGGYPADAAEGAVSAPDVNKTILTGKRQTNVLLVAAPIKEGMQVEVNGITITEGKATSNTPGRFVNGAHIYGGRGGALVVGNSKALFKNCTITDHSGYTAVVLYNADGAITTFENCKISDITGTNHGVGMFNTCATLIVKNTEFVNVQATGKGVGGAIYSIRESDKKEITPTTYVYNCLFKDNHIGQGDPWYSKRGAGIYFREGSKGIVVNTTFYGNIGGNGAGASAYGTASSPTAMTVIGCTFTQNNSFSYGALDFWDPGLKGERCVKSYVYNTITSGNISGDGSPDLNVTLKKDPLAGAMPNAFASCIDGAKVYDKTSKLTELTFDFNTMFAPYQNGTVKLQGDNNPALTIGMTPEELEAVVDMNDFPLFEKSYLSIDQKGNPRSGKTIGACVE